jgi:hypothetical protein
MPLPYGSTAVNDDQNAALKIVQPTPVYSQNSTDRKAPLHHAPQEPQPSDYSPVHLGHLVYEPHMRMPATASTTNSYYLWDVFIPACYLTVYRVSSDGLGQQNCFLSFLFRSNPTHFIGTLSNTVTRPSQYPSYDLQVVLEARGGSADPQYRVIQCMRIPFGSSLQKDKNIQKCTLSLMASIRRQGAHLNYSINDLPFWDQAQFVADTTGCIGCSYSPAVFLEYLSIYDAAHRLRQDAVKDISVNDICQTLSSILDRVLNDRHLSILFESENGTRYILSGAPGRQYLFKKDFDNGPVLHSGPIQSSELEWKDRHIQVNKVPYGPIKLFRVNK